MSILEKAALAVTLASSAVLGAAGAVLANDPIRIGMTVSQTGRFALAAQSGERGLRI